MPTKEMPYFFGRGYDCNQGAEQTPDVDRRRAAPRADEKSNIEEVD